MTTRSGGSPGFDDYVTARGPDLLRTAWCLTGDEDLARDLVARVLAPALSRWHRMTDEGLGAHDASVRRRLVHGFRPPGRRAGRSAGHGGGGLWVALAVLPAAERAVVALCFLDDLTAAQAADLLEVSVASVEHRVRRVLAALGCSEESLRAALAALVPLDPPTDGLAARAAAYAGRTRRVRRLATSGVAAVVVAAAALTLGAAHGRTPVPGPEPTATPAALSCAAQGAPAVATSTADRLSARADRVLVCARSDQDSVWSGSLPPDDPLERAAAIDLLELAPRTDGRECAPLPTGPAFHFLVRGRDHKVTSYANEGLECNGWPALSRYYVALAEQQAVDVTGAAGFLGCPAVFDRSGAGATRATRAPRGPGLPKGTRFTVATGCWHPVPRTDRIPRFLGVRSNVLGAPQLAQLDKDARRAGSRHAALPRCPDATALVVIRAMTSTRHLVELSGSCGPVFSVDWSPQDVWTVSADSSAMLRALLVVE